MDENEEIEDGDMDNDESDDSDDSNDDDEESSDNFVRKASKISSKVVGAKKKIISSNFNDRCESPYRKRKFVRKPIQPQVQDSIKQFKPTECHNIGCSQPARLSSKYCSDECGIKLAEQRLLKYLPSRIINWNNSVSICNQKDRRTQAEIQEECETIHYNLNILDKSHHDLIEFIDRWRSSCSASSNAEDDDRRVPGANDDSVQCVTCGIMVGSTKALAHMENCYQKIEGGTMVFADFEEQPIGSKLFCDFYDNNIRGYCKRLAALCDHNKDSKVDPKTICAFPLSVNEKSDKVCMTAKIKCNRHVNWERIQRAVIDMNRYRLLVRYEELQVEDRKFKHSIGQRGGVMSLLLHETIDHQPLKPLLPIKIKDRNNKMKKFTKAMCI
uniref:CXXC-type zinc finger protein 1 n=1 Tax=Schmidtea mediterranea TaxID=79327 RepID=A0A0X9ELX4_SCHMD|nr:CXXC1 [Schmidtea mediterranea]